MVFKLSIAFVALAALASAANFKRVACPDGKNTATNAAVSVCLDSVNIVAYSCGESHSAARSLLSAMTSRRTCSTTSVAKTVCRTIYGELNVFIDIVLVHESLRLTFHDAIGFSKSGEFK